MDRVERYDCSSDPDWHRDRVRSVEDLPDPFRKVFEGSFRYFNSLQSETFEASFESEHSLVVSGPTGSGKTVVMELAIMRLLDQNITLDGIWIPPKGRSKTIYIAPLKALVQEKKSDWSKRFQCLDLRCEEVTGDSFTDSSWSKIYEADVILTTPEKLDSVTRKYKDRGGLGYFSDIGLVLIDEVHVLNSSRGAALEAVISRLKVLSKKPDLSSSPISKLRFVAVSATIPNADDIGTWLGAPREGIKVFGEEMRSVKLCTHVRGYPSGKNDFMFHKKLTDHVMENIESFGKGKPVLVFCATRKGTVDAATKICKHFKEKRNSAEHWAPSLTRDHAEAISDLAKNKQLRETLRHGVAFHSAGLDGSDRSLVESLYLDRKIGILCATSTLAYGVNLPAHLVIILGTKLYDHRTSMYAEYDVSDCLQMIGRAGRPQFDSEAVAVIMTERSSVSRYQNLLFGAEPIESQLLHSLVEHVNAEVVLGTIVDLPSAMRWLKHSYFYVRLRKNPVLYGLRQCDIINEELLDKVLQERLLVKIMGDLTKFGLVSTHTDGATFAAEEPAKLMANYYLRFNTMKQITMMPPNASLPDLLMIICLSEEFSGIRLRRGEKRVLNTLNHKTEGLQYRILKDSRSDKPKERIATSAEKIFLLISYALSGHLQINPLESSLRQELEHILHHAPRIASCIEKYADMKRSLASTANSIRLRRCIRARIWDGCNAECKQLPSVSKQISERLAQQGCGTLDELQRQDPRKIEALTKRSYPFGNTVQSELGGIQLPFVEFQYEVTKCGHDSIFFVLTMIAVRPELSHESLPLLKGSHKAHVILGSLEDDQLLLHELITITDHDRSWQFPIEAKTQSNAKLRINAVAAVISDEVVGMDRTSHFCIDGNYVNTCKTINGKSGPTPETAAASDKQPHPIIEHTSNLCSTKRIFAKETMDGKTAHKSKKKMKNAPTMFDVLSKKHQTLMRTTIAKANDSASTYLTSHHPAIQRKDYKLPSVSESNMHHSRDWDEDSHLPPTAINADHSECEEQVMHNHHQGGQITNCFLYS